MVIPRAYTSADSQQGSPQGQKLLKVMHRELDTEP